jgi:hypothetical protein
MWVVIQNLRQKLHQNNGNGMVRHLKCVSRPLQLALACLFHLFKSRGMANAHFMPKRHRQVLFRNNFVKSYRKAKSNSFKVSTENTEIMFSILWKLSNPFHCSYNRGYKLLKMVILIYHFLFSEHRRLLNGWKKK